MKASEVDRACKVDVIVSSGRSAELINIEIQAKGVSSFGHTLFHASAFGIGLIQPAQSNFGYQLIVSVKCNM